MTKAEKLMRRTGITAAEALGLAGLSPLTPLTIYRRKLRQPHKLEPVPRARRATEIRAVLAAYTKRVGLKPTRQPLVRNPVQRFAISEPYFTVSSPVDDTRLVLPFSLSCAPWSALPPPLIASAHWGLGVTGFERADVAILFRKTLKIFCLHWDPLIFSRLYGFAEHFMAECVLQKVSPETPGEEDE